MSNSSNDSSKTHPLRLVIRGLGPFISFKNHKSLGWKWTTDKKTGKPKKIPMMRTDPKYKTWMEKAVECIVSQLCFGFPTGSGKTTRECSKLHAILSCLPEDDCWTQLEIGSVKTILVPKGEEGADIIIERI